MTIYRSNLKEMEMCNDTLPKPLSDSQQSTNTLPKTDMPAQTNHSIKSNSTPDASQHVLGTNTSTKLSYRSWGLHYEIIKHEDDIYNSKIKRSPEKNLRRSNADKDRIRLFHTKPTSQPASKPDNAETVTIYIEEMPEDSGDFFFYEQEFQKNITIDPEKSIHDMIHSLGELDFICEYLPEAAEFLRRKANIECPPSIYTQKNETLASVSGNLQVRNEGRNINNSGRKHATRINRESKECNNTQWEKRYRLVSKYLLKILKELRTKNISLEDSDYSEPMSSVSINQGKNYNSSDIPIESHKSFVGGAKVGVSAVEETTEHNSTVFNNVTEVSQDMTAAELFTKLDSSNIGGIRMSKDGIKDFFNEKSNVKVFHGSVLRSSSTGSRPSNIQSYGNVDSMGMKIIGYPDVPQVTANGFEPILQENLSFRYQNDGNMKQLILPSQNDDKIVVDASLPNRNIYMGHVSGQQVSPDIMIRYTSSKSTETNLEPFRAEDTTGKKAIVSTDMPQLPTDGIEKEFSVYSSIKFQEKSVRSNMGQSELPSQNNAALVGKVVHFPELVNDGHASDQQDPVDLFISSSLSESKASDIESVRVEDTIGRKIMINADIPQVTTEAFEKEQTANLQSKFQKKTDHSNIGQPILASEHNAEFVGKAGFPKLIDGGLSVSGQQDSTDLLVSSSSIESKLLNPESFRVEDTMGSRTISNMSEAAVKGSEKGMQSDSSFQSQEEVDISNTRKRLLPSQDDAKIELNVGQPEMNNTSTDNRYESGQQASADVAISYTSEESKLPNLETFRIKNTKERKIKANEDMSQVTANGFEEAGTGDLPLKFEGKSHRSQTGKRILSSEHIVELSDKSSFPVFKNGGIEDGDVAGNGTADLLISSIPTKLKAPSLEFQGKHNMGMKIIANPDKSQVTANGFEKGISSNLSFDLEGKTDNFSMGQRNKGLPKINGHIINKEHSNEQKELLPFFISHSPIESDEPYFESFGDTMEKKIANNTDMSHVTFNVFEEEQPPDSSLKLVEKTERLDTEQRESPSQQGDKLIGNSDLPELIDSEKLSEQQPSADLLINPSLEESNPSSLEFSGDADAAGKKITDYPDVPQVSYNGFEAGIPADLSFRFQNDGHVGQLILQSQDDTKFADNAGPPELSDRDISKGYVTRQPPSEDLSTIVENFETGVQFESENKERIKVAPQTTTIGSKNLQGYSGNLAPGHFGSSDLEIKYEVSGRADGEMKFNKKGNGSLSVSIAKEPSNIDIKSDKLSLLPESDALADRSIDIPVSPHLPEATMNMKNSDLKSISFPESEVIFEGIHNLTNSEMNTSGREVIVKGSALQKDKISVGLTNESFSQKGPVLSINTSDKYFAEEAGDIIVETRDSDSLSLVPRAGSFKLPGITSQVKTDEKQIADISRMVKMDSPILKGNSGIRFGLKVRSISRGPSSGYGSSYERSDNRYPISNMETNNGFENSLDVSEVIKTRRNAEETEMKAFDLSEDKSQAESGNILTHTQKERIDETSSNLKKATTQNKRSREKKQLRKIKRQYFKHYHPCLNVNNDEDDIPLHTDLRNGIFKSHITKYLRINDDNYWKNTGTKTKRHESNSDGISDRLRDYFGLNTKFIFPSPDASNNHKSFNSQETSAKKYVQAPLNSIPVLKPIHRLFFPYRHQPIKQQNEGKQPKSLTLRIVYRTPLSAQPPKDVKRFGKYIGAENEFNVEEKLHHVYKDQLYRKGSFSVLHINPETLELEHGKRRFKHDVLPGQREGQRRKEPQHILGGRSEDQPWPWMVSIYVYPTMQFVCAGSLIDDQHIVSAAHCYVNLGPTIKYVVQIGSLKRIIPSKESGVPIAGTVTHKVKKLYMHENFTMECYCNDISILKLEKPLGPEYIPICLPQYDPAGVGENVTVLGWGNTKYSKKGIRGTTYLQRLDDITITDSEACRKIMSKIAGIDLPLEFTKYYICAGVPDGGKDACAGDSGGPLLHEDYDGIWSLVGVVSFGYKCGEPGVPGTYTRISYYIPWIMKIVALN